MLNLFESVSGISGVVFSALYMFCCRLLTSGVAVVIWAVTCHLCIIFQLLELIRHKATLALQPSELVCFVNTGTVL